MHYIPKLICFLALIISFSSSCAQNPQTNVSSKATEDTIKMVENGLSGSVQIQDSVNTWNIEERMKAKGINGVSIAMIRDYKIAWAKGYGLADKDANTPVTTQTLFQAASLSKSLNAVGVLKLAQDKKI